MSESTERIKRIMEEKGHSQSSIAAEIGCTAAAVNRVVNGSKGTASMRYAVAAVLGHRVESLWPPDDDTLQTTQEVMDTIRSDDARQAAAVHALRPYVPALRMAERAAAVVRDRMLDRNEPHGALEWDDARSEIERLRSTILDLPGEDSQGPQYQRQARLAKEVVS